MDKNNLNLMLDLEPNNPSIEARLRIERLHAVEEKMGQIMEIVTTVLENLPIDHVENEKDSEAYKLKVVGKVNQQIQAFGPLMNAVQSELRQHFRYMSDNGIIDLGLPIQSDAGAKFVDKNIWSSLVSSLDRSLENDIVLKGETVDLDNYQE